jgi:NAD(P)-dependent dehydrogenase (short-subunit alcohol dehydrogenase family)
MHPIEHVFAQPLAGQHALVVGGSSGIGAAIGRGLEAGGARVTVTGATDAEVAQALAAPDGKGKHALRLDVTDDAAVRALIGGLPRLDILVNCAGIIRRGAEHEPEVFEKVVAVNLLGTMRCCAAARPLLARQGGSIVNIASMLSFFGGGLVPGYSASKGGVAQLTKSLAIAYAAESIRVNAIAPGWIATPLTHTLQEDEERSRAILSRTPMRRWGKPEDVAGTAVFLCTQAAAFVTGAVIPVDGGYLIN